MKKKIILDFTSIEKENTGIETFAYYIIKYLLKIYFEFSVFQEKIEFKVIVTEENEHLLDEFKEKNIEFIILENNKRVYNEQRYIPKKLKDIEFDYIFSPAYGVSLRYAGKSIITVHDAYFSQNADYQNIRNKIYWKLFYPIILRRAKHIITVSEFSKKELLKINYLKDKEIKVIKEAAKDSIYIIKHNIEAQGIREKYNIENDFFLYTGSLNPRKNIKLLLDAFSEFCKKNDSYLLVLAGKQQTKEIDYKRYAKHINIDNNVRFLDYINEYELNILYNLASALVILSKYEGFCLPVVEALKVNTPVILSDLEVFRELYKDIPIYIKDFGIKSIIEAFEKIDDSDFMIRKIIQTDKINSLYSWEKSAKELIEYFIEI